MKKVSKLSLTLSSVGIFLICLACFLQYKISKNVSLDAVSYGTVTLNDSYIKKDNESLDDFDKKNVDEVVIDEELREVKLYEDVTTVAVEEIVYDGLTLNQLADKLNRILKSSISNKGYLIASYSLQLGIDPYVSTAIILHETGCNGTCSSLVQKCNNVGGQKGGPSCNGGSYKAYATLDDGIRGYLDNLYNNYYSKGLRTPEAIGPKYASSSSWVFKVNNYVNMIRNS